MVQLPGGLGFRQLTLKKVRSIDFIQFRGLSESCP